MENRDQLLFEPQVHESRKVESQYVKHLAAIFVTQRLNAPHLSPMLADLGSVLKTQGRERGEYTVRNSLPRLRKADSHSRQIDVTQLRKTRNQIVANRPHSRSEVKR